jgi:hypothetical protein
MKHCHICYKIENDIFTCDKCLELYCEDCSYTYTIHFQYEGCLCHWCSGQKRLKKLKKSDIRENKLKLIL